MTFKEYLRNLADSNDLRIVKAPVNGDLELAAICRREFAQKGGGSALLFEKVHGSPFPVAANLFGNERRIAALLHSTSLDHFTEKLRNWLEQKSGSSTERCLSSDKVDTADYETPKLIETADLYDLPAIKSWPHEGGHYLNLALTLTRHPETGKGNLGLYRVQILNDNRLALNFSPQSGAGKHFSAARQCGKALPVCLLMGVDPALLWVAAAPLPDSCDEFEFYRSMFRQNLSWSEAATQPLKIPAETDIVIEGEVRIDQTVVEGPYGNHTGYYVTRRDCPLVAVTAVRCRQQAVVPQTVVGPPPSENIYLGTANEILIREMIKIDFPRIRDVWMPPETLFHGATVIAVKPDSPAENKELIYALWQDSPLSRARFLLLVDEDIHLRSLSNSWWRMVNGLKTPRIYSEGGRTAIDATTISPEIVVKEDSQTAALLQRRKDEY